MQVVSLTTNGGPHPADKWAITSVAQIMQGVFSPEAADTIGAKEFELALLKILGPHHDRVQKHERSKIHEHGMDRLAHEVDPREHCAAVVAEIVEAAKKIGSIKVPDADNPGQEKSVDVAAHFAREDVQAVIAGMIGSHFASAMDIERSWHADRNADHPEARAYREARTKHGAALVHSHIHHYRTRPAV